MWKCLFPSLLPTLGSGEVIDVSADIMHSDVLFIYF